MRAQITNYIRAGYPGLYLLSHEEQRVEAELKAVAEALEYRLFAWSTTTGLVDTANGHARENITEPLEAVASIRDLDENTLVLLRDFHLFLEDGNGVPGTGKSLTAKAAAHVLQRPLIKLDIGALMGSLVGESEANLRTAIHVAEAIAPCIVWVDELDKGLSGSKSSGATDGGTSARVFGSLISWMQERTAPVFMIATANDVTQLPPELLRKGRWDEIFWTDLPNRTEREAIWRIKIAQSGRDPDAFDIQMLAGESDGSTGAEIEGLVTDSLFRAFAQEREPTTADMQSALRETVPLSKLSDQVEAMRKWSKGRARPATTPEPQPKGRKLAT